MTLPRRLGATYRLQLRPGWGFEAAARTVPYLARLGIETVYLSPVAEAVPGSTHGYDGTDPAHLRRELGGEPAYDALVAACEAHGLGICVDHVPNHLATWHRGPWWRRLLAEGPDSEMGEVFDVDWDAAIGPAGRPQVLLPLLDRPADDALAAGLVRLGERDGEAVIEVGEGDGVDLPVAAGTARSGDDVAGVLADDVAGVLAAQHYRLVDWHDAAARNYRRFFDIDGLVGVRVEVPAVFDRTHRLLVDLARSGRLSAVRVDHVDGLRDPAGYLRRLADATGVPVVVEKILTGDEQLHPGWPVAGTTGYEVVDDVAGVLVDAGGLDRLTAAAQAEGDQPVAPLTVETRRLVAAASFPAELARAARGLDVAADALADVVVRLPRYRTYLRPADAGDDTGADAGDDAAEAGELAIWHEAAGAAPGGLDGEAAGAAPGGLDGEAAGAAPGGWDVAAAVADPGRRGGVLGLQQVTGAVMAKGVEDTAWYRLAGPLALCEVGGDPALDRHDGVERFHARAAARVAGATLGLVPGTTHDTKRSEDARCRLYALSELPDAFERGLAAARAELGLPAGGGDLAFETRVAVQLALAILPPSAAVGAGGAAGIGGAAGAGGGRLPSELGDARWPEGTTLARRLGAALEKGAREAKRRSSWQRPDAAYEERLAELATTLLADDAAVLRRAFGPMVPELARRGAINSLSALVLRHASPGTPDTYQGDEVWNLSLVDPDNRRPVDHGLLARALDGLPPPGTGAPAPGLDDLRRQWHDGRVKLFVTGACLAARRGPGGAALAAGGRHVPLAAEGPAAGSIVTFGRAAPDGSWAVAVATRRGGALAVAEPVTSGTRAAAPAAPSEGPGALTPGDLPFGPSFARTWLALPPEAPPALHDAISGRAVDAAAGRLALDEVLATLPVALLVASPAGRGGTGARA